MCIKIKPRCARCGLPQETEWDFCEYAHHTARPARGRSSDASLLQHPEMCRYGGTLHLPVLWGCRDIDTCASWLTTFFSGFSGRHCDEVRDESDGVAEECLERYKTDFMRDCRREGPYGPPEDPVPFLVAASRDMHKTDANDYSGAADTIRLFRRHNRRVRLEETQLAEQGQRVRYPRSPAPPPPRRPHVETLALSPETPLPDVPEAVHHRPRRMTHLRPVYPARPVVTRTNPLIGLYGSGAPRPRGCMARAELCNEPEVSAVEFMASLLGAQQQPRGGSSSGPWEDSVRTLGVAKYQVPFRLLTPYPLCFGKQDNFKMITSAI